jgi:hypothetical protein
VRGEYGVGGGVCGVSGCVVCGMRCEYGGVWGVCGVCEG